MAHFHQNTGPTFGMGQMWHILYCQRDTVRLETSPKRRSFGIRSYSNKP